MWKALENRLQRFREQIKQARAGEITSRYFVINAFDGAMTALGVIIGAYLGGRNTLTVILAALGAMVAMGISGLSGAYLAEEAMRTRHLKELEKAVFRDLSGSQLERASQTAVLWVAFVDAISPAVAAGISIAPLLLAFVGIIPLTSAVLMSVALAFVTLFALGLYLGKLSRRSIISYGMKTVMAGVATALIILLVGSI
ncbi:MAG: hypothetical protein OEY99_05380 [Aigarchaeota archaeon]|nr:hypothetical protein [Aigarchaeota archaeon]